MMNRVLLLAVLTVSLLSSPAMGRKALAAKEEVKVRTPRVDATSSTACLIKTSSFYFCYVMQGPFAQVGW